MTPAEAMDALRRVEGYEESLTARAAGITGMLWGIVVAGIFMTYTAAGAPLSRAGDEWAFGLLWMPWVLVGVVATGHVWSAHAISLHRQASTGKGILISSLYTLGFLLILGGAFALFEYILDWGWNAQTVALLANADFAFIIGAIHRYHREPGGIPYMAAALLIGAGAFVLGALDLADAPTGFLAAAIAGSCWFGAGLWTYRSG